MRRESLILGIVLVVLIFVFYIYNSYSEGFETIRDKIQDRVNNLAGQQNPITNPAARIGISEAEGSKLRTLTEAALNSPIAVADGAGSYKQTMPQERISARIDNENSFLGLVKMCKEKGVGENPFNDSAFAENCGMCITSGKLVSGESFNTPTGVVVYKADKDEANATKMNNGYAFARAVPSLNSANCLGANKDNDSLPVLAINQKDFDAFRKRKACRDSHKIGEQCGRCVANQESTWVPPSGGIMPLTLYLWGAGKANVSLANGFKSKELSLSNTATTVQIGRPVEGTGIQISVNSADGPYVYGVIVSPTAAKGIYKLPIEKFMERDSITGNAPRRNGVKYFDDVKVFCTKLMTQSDKTSMNLKGFIPITMVEPDELAAFDCPSAPIVQSQESAELLIDDACLNPRGQGPGRYSEECIKQTMLQGGCSTNGYWYKKYGMYLRIQPDNTLSDLLTFFKNSSIYSENDPQISMACKGIDISSPCDAYLNGGIPDAACMNYLYFNQSEKNKRIGRAYKYADTKYASIVKDGLLFCRGGSLRPGYEDSSKLIDAAKGYKGLSGIEAVKMYLSDVFMKAVGNLDINLEDDKGGRKTSWKQCMYFKITDPPLASVVKNSINDVIDNRANCFPFPKFIDITRSQGKLLGQITLTEDYTLSFNITPKGINSNWGNIIHFSPENYDGSRCPAIWFWPGELRLHVIISDKTAWNWGINTDAIPINQSSSFRLECKGNQVTVTVNDKIYRATQPSQRVLGNALVYAANPWYIPANANLENLCYIGGGSTTELRPNYTCVKGWDNLGLEMACYRGINMTGRQAEEKCNNDPNCGSYNTYNEGGGGIGTCLKRTKGTVLNNRNNDVTSYCFKNT